MRKTIIRLFAVCLFLYGSYQIYFITNSDYNNNYYTSVKAFIRDNGEENFIDMYNPSAYFEVGMKKKKLSETNRVKIYYYYSSDPALHHTMSFKNVYKDVVLNVTIDKTEEFNEHDEMYTCYELSNGHKVYIYTDQFESYIKAKHSDFNIMLSFEFLSNLTKEEINNIELNVISMSEDALYLYDSK